MFLVDIDWNVPNNVSTPPEPEQNEDSPPLEEPEAPSPPPPTTTNTVNVYIIAKENGGLLAVDSESRLNLTGQFGEENSQWSILDSGDDAGRVYIASNDGAYLHNNAGTLEPATLDSDDLPGFLWTLNYEGQHGMMTIMSNAEETVRYIEAPQDPSGDDDHIRISSGDQEDPGRPIGPSQDAYFTIQVLGMTLT